MKLEFFSEDVEMPDFDKEKAKSWIENTAKNENKIILLDSGNYESYWHKNKEWTPDKFRSILESNCYNMAFNFDYQNLQGSIDDIADIIISTTIKDQEKATDSIVMPIIHTQKEMIAYVAAKVVETIEPEMIAIPERNLGEGLLERVKILHQIRNTLNNLGYYCPIHLLGTDSPLSILLFSLFGADSFDGLLWCVTTADYDTGLLHHFHQSQRNCPKSCPKDQWFRQDW